MLARRLVRISRPKFWLYLTGTFFLGGVLASHGLTDFREWRFWWLLVWFTLPANLLLYGINDAFDFDTDQHNSRKEHDEVLVYPRERPRLFAVILALTLLAIPPLLGSNPRAVAYFGAFLLLSWVYSAPPLRLKARPLLDSASNVLYIMPLLVAWSLFDRGAFPLPLMVAGTLWCAGMHAYSAIPDIEADTSAGLSTTATLLGRNGTLGFCVGCYLSAAIIVWWYDTLAGLLLLVYPLVMLAQLVRSQASVRRWYRYFPLINGLLGMALTWRFLLPDIR